MLVSIQYAAGVYDNGSTVGQETLLAHVSCP